MEYGSVPSEVYCPTTVFLLVMFFSNLRLDKNAHPYLIDVIFDPPLYSAIVSLMASEREGRLVENGKNVTRHVVDPPRMSHEI